jgi:hypothetical protein
MELTRNEQLAARATGSTVVIDLVAAETGKYEDTRAMPPSSAKQPQTSPNPFRG